MKVSYGFLFRSKLHSYFKTVVKDVIFFLIAVISLIYVSMDSEFIFKKRVGLLAAFVVYFTYKNFGEYVSIKTVYFSLICLLLGLFLQYASPGFFNTFAEVFMNRLHFQMEAGRGFTSFTPEPTFLAASMSLASFLLKDLSSRQPSYEKKYYVFQLLILLSILATKSFSGIIFFVLTAWNLLGYRKTLLVGLVCIAMLLLVDFSDTRFYQLFIKIVSGDAMFDGSLAHRFSNLYSAWYALTTQPWGYGGGTFSIVGLEANQTLAQPVLDSAASRSVSSFSRLIVEGGFFTVVFFIYMYLLANRSSPVSAKTLSALLLFTTFPVVFPGIWILLLINRSHPYQARTSV